MTDKKDPIDNLSYVANEAKKALETDLESTGNSSLEPFQHDPAIEKRLMRKIDIWRKIVWREAIINIC